MKEQASLKIIRTFHHQWKQVNGRSS